MYIYTFFKVNTHYTNHMAYYIHARYDTFTHTRDTIHSYTRARHICTTRIYNTVNNKLGAHNGTRTGLSKGLGLGGSNTKRRRALGDITNENGKSKGLGGKGLGPKKKGLQAQSKNAPNRSRRALGNLSSNALNRKVNATKSKAQSKNRRKLSVKASGGMMMKENFTPQLAYGHLELEGMYGKQVDELCKYDDNVDFALINKGLASEQLAMGMGKELLLHQYDKVELDMTGLDDEHGGGDTVDGGLGDGGISLDDAAFDLSDDDDMKEVDVGAELDDFNLDDVDLDLDFDI